MTNKIPLLVAVTVFALAPSFASAQEEIGATSVEPTVPAETEVAARANQPETIKAVVRGLFVEARVGGGLMLVGANIPRRLRTRYPEAGSTEDLGGGALVHLAAGYDISDMIAMQAVGGATLVSGGGDGGLVRDLSMVFGGAGMRLAFGITSRLHVLAEVGVAYVSAADGVKPGEQDLGRSSSGVAALGGIGVEYYVHVRHFSVGLDLTVFAPFDPFRIFVGLAPTVKYTF